ncbi:hypothetical protein [Variovorax boronicumulans]|uniref:hypothetical protein n=1 Tax=Variovorax boronicumulans TaxID=436515 RepID=UPI00132F8F52|nr:hypothetical protein [Variovorax boronicumulans]
MSQISGGNDRHDIRRPYSRAMRRPRPVKRFALLAAGAVALLIASAVAYRGYRVNVSTYDTSTAVSSDESRAQGRLLAKLRFDAPSFGDCSVHDAWLEKSSTFVTRSWFGIRLGNETIPTAAIHVVLNIPKDPFLSAQSLSFDETNPTASSLGLTGSFTQTVTINAKRYRLFGSNTVFPPPAVMTFSCGTANAHATLAN